MSINYFISETKPTNIGFYRQCFSKEDFCEGYGVIIDPKELDLKVDEIALRPYKNVRRFILFYKNMPVSYCHFFVSDDVAIVSGGILPELLDTGKGVFAAIIFYDFYFRTFSPKALITEIKKENFRSLRIHKAFGFMEISIQSPTKYKLSVENFPNTFTKQLLSKIKYESEQVISDYFP